MILLTVISFCSAFLLFQIELIIAKLFLPYYGGSYLVWGACIVFFQAVLLGGYVFAHALLQRWGVHHYLKAHLALLFIPFLFFPLCDTRLFYSTVSLPVVLDIFRHLILTIGPVFGVLSTMSLVTQSWLAASSLKQRDNPYRLYAVSNLGSFAALLTYPFVFERYLTNTGQLHLWRLLYVVLVLANVLAWTLVKPDEKRIQIKEALAAVPVPVSQVLRWLCLSAASVVMFLSVTNIISYEIAPVPLMWVIPLGIYLMAFVLNFKKDPWCPSWMVRLIGPIIGAGAMMYFLSQRHILPILVVIALLCVFLFCICMFTQNQLILSRPSSDRQMTFFYVMISLGGFIGGMLTTWVIPLVSNTFIEYLIGLLLVSLMVPRSSREIPVWALLASVLAVVSAFLVWPHFFNGYHTAPFVLLWVTVWFSFLGLASERKIFIAVMASIIMAAPVLESIWQNAHFIIKKRNYYGVYEVYDGNFGVRALVRTLVHGSTMHGVEFIDEKLRGIPAGYYSPVSAIGTLLTADVFTSRRIGAVGLGTGTISMYARQSCPIDFYELDDDVYRLASKYFWYLAKAPGNVQVIIGDARLSLKRVPDASYDLLIIDAFSGDSIPTHLINKDVIMEYHRKLSSRGAVVFHITNRYLNLEPVLADIAGATGALAAVKEVPSSEVNLDSTWCVLTWDKERFVRLTSREGWRKIDPGTSGDVRVWSDEYSSILPIIDWDAIVGPLKSFKLLVW